MAVLRALFLALLLTFAVFVSAQDEDLADDPLHIDNFYEDDEGERKYDPELEDKIKAALEGYVETFEVEQDDSEDEEEEEEGDEKNFYYQPGSQLSSYFLFPQSAETDVIYLGEENELLVAFKNDYDAEINITAIRLSIMHPMEPTFYYLQNCTPEFYYQTIAPETTKTFYYKFTPDAMLQPRSYVVVTNVYFEGPRGRNFMYQALNATHEFDDAPAKLDTQILFMIFSIVGLFGFIGYLIFSSIKTGKRRAGGASGSASGKGEVKDEWLSHLTKGGKKKGGKLNKSN